MTDSKVDEIFEKYYNDAYMANHAGYREKRTKDGFEIEQNWTDEKSLVQAKSALRKLLIERMGELNLKRDWEDMPIGCYAGYKMCKNDVIKRIGEILK